MFYLLKEFSPPGMNSFHYELTLFEKEGKNERLEFLVDKLIAKFLLESNFVNICGCKFKTLANIC